MVQRKEKKIHPFSFSEKITAKLGAEDSAKLSTLFDFGGILGAIAAGMISDYSGMSACTCTAMLTLAVPMLFVYQKFGALSIHLNVILLFLLGILVSHVCETIKLRSRNFNQQ